MDVTSVNVYALNNQESAPQGIEVYASMDGINYDLVVSKEYDITDATGNLDKFIVEMPGTVYARDIKIVIDGNSNTMVHEIEAFGRPIYAIEKVRATEYSYDEEVPFVTAEDIRNQDANRTALSDSSTAQIYTTGDYVSVIYDLGKFCQVDEIKIKGNHGGFELLTSPDGFTYFSSAYYEAASGESIAYGRAENNAKFVKIVFHKPESSNIILSEIELYTRELIDVQETNIPVRATLKPNNVLYLDWSDHNANGEQKTYNVYIEENYFTDVAALEAKPVQVGRGSTTNTDVAANFATYIGLAPSTDYYVAIAEKGGATAVTPIKITSYDVFGGDAAAAIFNVNEYDDGVISGSEVRKKLNEGDFEILKLWPDDNITQAELDALPEEGDADNKVKKLLGDIESVQRNRDYNYPEGKVRNWASYGLSMLTQHTGQADKLKDLGIYEYGHYNEPEILEKYGNGLSGTDEAAREDQVNFGETFGPVVKEAYTNLKAKNPEALLASPSLCGTGNWRYLDALYETNRDIGEYYDVLDIHMYNTKGEDASEYIDGADYDIPERVFGKVDTLSRVLEEYEDEKPIISSETGWSDADSTEECKWGVVKNVEPEQKAEYVARMFLSYIMAGVKEVYLYAFQDSGYLTDEDIANGNNSYITRIDKGEGNSYIDVKQNVQTPYYIARQEACHEHQFGIVDWWGNPEAGYYSFYTLGKMLRDTYYVGSLDMPDLCYGAVFYDKLKDKYLTALWEVSGRGKDVEIVSDENRLTKVGMYGGVSTVTPGDIRLTTSPVYIYSDRPLEINWDIRQVISGNGIGNSNANIVKTYADQDVDITVSDNVAIFKVDDTPDTGGLLNQGVFDIASAMSGNCYQKNGATVEVIVDLGKEFMVDGVDASAYYEKPFLSSSKDKLSKIKVELSTDGVSYSPTFEKNITEGTDDVWDISTATTDSIFPTTCKELLTTNTFTSVRARYVKVTLTGNSQVKPNEIIVFGK